MAKKPDKKSKDKKVEPTKNEARALICQHCKHHSNRPSKCKVTGKYVPRKCEACDKFKEVK